jgi:hypothetical protein
MYTKAQTDVFLAQQAATYVRTANGVEWWRLADGSWIARRALNASQYELRRFPANSCGC